MDSFNDFFEQAKNSTKRVLLIGHLNEFLIKSVNAEMTRRGFTLDMCEPEIDEVSQHMKDIDVCLLFVDSADCLKELLVYLKDITTDKRTEMGFVGERLELQEAVKYIQRENVGKLFERPVDARQISDGLEELAKDVEKKSEKRKILIIDDDPEFLRRTQSVLHNHYKIYIANSGASALMLLSKHNDIDLILLDYIMPVLDGPKVLQALKTEPETKDIPVIFLSGQTDAKSITTAMTMGSENYLSKSLAATDLAAMIADFFAKKDWQERENMTDPVAVSSIF